MSVEHVDVLIVGAGLSGIGAGYHLQANCPGKTYAILEARERIGGTWDLFRYPGIRSDSDMYTLGYSFRPWTDAKAIADGPSILELRARDRHGETASSGRSASTTAWCARSGRAHRRAGRWRRERGDTQRDGAADLRLPVHVQRLLPLRRGLHARLRRHRALRRADRASAAWPEDLDYAGKRVVVIGSGATAVTLVPAMAQSAAHVTMLQRSPSYIVSLPAEDPIAKACAAAARAKAAYPIMRWKNVLLTMSSFQLCRRRPELMKRLVRKGHRAAAPGRL